MFRLDAPGTPPAPRWTPLKLPNVPSAAISARETSVQDLSSGGVEWPAAGVLRCAECPFLRAVAHIFVTNDLALVRLLDKSVTARREHHEKIGDIEPRHNSTVG